MHHEGLSLETISLDDLLNFFLSLQNMKQENVKNFLLYMKDHSIIKHDLLLAYIKPIRYKKEKIPSYYTTEEVRQIENSVNRYSTEGKRDYAMLLLASRLGLRSADIRNLKFSDIDWDKNENEIHIRQIKT